MNNKEAFYSVLCAKAKRFGLELYEEAGSYVFATSSGVTIVTSQYIEEMEEYISGFLKPAMFIVVFDPNTLTYAATNVITSVCKTTLLTACVMLVDATQLANIVKIGTIYKEVDFSIVAV